MTVTSDVNIQAFTGDGVTKIYPFTIQAYNESWIIGGVDRENSSGVTLLYPDQETNAGGTFTFDVAPPDGSLVSIVRIVPLTQLVDFPDYGPFPARNNEDALDKLTMASTEFLNGVTGGTIESPIDFNDYIAMLNDTPIYFKNLEGSISPFDNGVFRLISDGTETWAIEASNASSDWLRILTVTAQGAHFPEGVSSGMSPMFIDDLTRKDYVDQVVAALGAMLQAQIDNNADGITTLFTQKADVTYVDAQDDALQAQITINTDNVATKADTTYVDAQDSALQNQITTNDLDIADLQTDKVAKAGDSMIGNLDVNYPPINDASAAPRVWVIEQIQAGGGVVFLGYYDASGNVTPPDGDNTGDYYIIAAAGTINVSDGIDPPAATAVAINDRITWDFGIGAGAWALTVPSSIAATEVTFANAGTNYASINVQTALVEADATMFVHAAGNINEAVTGNKSFTSNIFMGNGRAVQLKGATDSADGAGALNMYTNGTDITLFEKRNAAGNAWLSIMRVLATGLLEVSQQTNFSIGIDLNNSVTVIFRNALGESSGLGSNRIFNNGNNDWLLQYHNGVTWATAIELRQEGQVFITDLQGFVDLTTNQTISGVKTFDNTTAISNNTSLRMLGTGGGTINGGTFDMYTDAANVSYFRKRDAAGNAWLPVFNILTDGNIEQFSIVNHYDPVRMVNAVPIELRNALGGVTGLGAMQIVLTGSNIMRFLHHNGVDFQNTIELLQDGSTRISGADGVASAFIDNSGPTVTGINSVITREKGDFRYVDLTTEQSVFGIKKWQDAQTVAQQTRSSWNGTRTFGNISGNFSIYTDLSDVTHFEKANAAGDAWLPVMTINPAASLGIGAPNLDIASAVFVANGTAISFRNDAGSGSGLGSNRILNGGDNTFLIQHHSGVGWQNAMVVQADGVTVFYDSTGQDTAFIDLDGVNVSSANSIITREKGDQRYSNWSATEAAAAAFNDGLIHFADEGS